MVGLFFPEIWQNPEQAGRYSDPCRIAADADCFRIHGGPCAGSWASGCRRRSKVAKQPIERARVGGELRQWDEPDVALPSDATTLGAG